MLAPLFVCHEQSEVGTVIGMPNQMPFLMPLLPHHTQIIAPHYWPCNSPWPPYNQFPTNSAFNPQYAPNYLQHDLFGLHRPQEGSHVLGMPAFYDPQSGMHPTYQMQPMPELYSFPHPTFIPMPPNHYDHQYGYRPMVHESVVPTGHDMDQSVAFGTSYNPLDLRPAMPPSHPQFYGHQDHNQIMMPDALRQQAVNLIQFSGARNAGPQMHSGHACLNRTIGHVDRAGVFESSSVSGLEAGEQLHQSDPQAIDTSSSASRTNRQRTQTINSQNQREEERPRCGGRRKRFDVGESSSAPKRSRKDFTMNERGETSNNPREATKASRNEEEEEDNISVSNPTPARETTNYSIYDPQFEEKGLPIDPHLRMLKF